MFRWDGSGWMNGDRINGLFQLPVNGIYWGEITH